jgi:hypothetical protein
MMASGVPVEKGLWSLNNYWRRYIAVGEAFRPRLGNLVEA